MKVSLFITCLSDVFFPHVGQSVVEVLERYGVEVDFSQAQTCCGQPAYNSGYHKDARKAAKHMVEVFGDSEYVVAPSGSCVAMIRHYYPELLKDNALWYKRAKAVAEKTYEFSEFLVHVLKVDKVDAHLRTTATYHHSCHMSRGLGLKQEPAALLSQVEGLRMEELPYCQDCCGFGGTFAAKMSAISEAMVDEKIKHIEETGANVLIGSDMGCLMNIGGRLRRSGKEIQVMHVAEVLARGGTK
ncbi:MULTISPECIES: (Fe-S)-binding protein [Aneurinibacillus]|uniref:(Fe-S)-binding protein n=1 Tax=Aneurinibacillus thermoaerophilus TaxID=143495 RepID=A0A1G7WWW1_ANETH|nr:MULTISPECIES: (Fe-S)-binding protein [Aneurinibacillus]AMA73911.1 Fe-S oxidoreductase [Aneurinibacillus sp. XH2]MED0674095.1 (Fe-S)-binding protein [Aneurinibacillus thermoaerophilus]MED0737729.1 (Fe-S)-binding protein [Aneurinibacillus thermoaerophilus]MED0755716.1 (Fe-S)-binding protein [Aneurinibacillus thermoaerophilus]MED0759955.1 (Fe-S)-binding protein [Aneurinibacillus thermoaerophilus]